MAEGDDPRDPSTASGMPVPPPWPVVDKGSTYQHPPDYGVTQPAPSYGPRTAPPGRTGGSRRWLVVALVVVVLLALVLWLLLR